MTLLLVYFLLIIFRYMRRILHRFRLSREETVTGAFYTDVQLGRTTQGDGALDAAPKHQQDRLAEPDHLPEARARPNSSTSRPAPV